LTSRQHQLIIPLVSSVVFIAVLAAVLAAPTLTRAAIFAWHDTDGVTHYVDNLDNVPSEYRGGVVTFVKDWKRAAPPAESVAPAPAPDTPSVPSVEKIEIALRSFERGFWEGHQSAMAAQPKPVVVPASSTVQNVQIILPPQLAATFPFFGPVFPVRARLHPNFPRRFFRGRFFHGRLFGGRFIQGPAGRAPLGAPGPPPVMFFRHARR
jgi:hypothetical protein